MAEDQQQTELQQKEAELAQMNKQLQSHGDAGGEIRKVARETLYVLRDLRGKE